MNISEASSFDLVVVGSGAAGLMAALTAADLGHSVAVVEGTPSLAARPRCPKA